MVVKFSGGVPKRLRKKNQLHIVPANTETPVNKISDVVNEAWEVPLKSDTQEAKPSIKKLPIDWVEELVYNLWHRWCSRLVMPVSLATINLSETLTSGEPHRGPAAEPTVSANSLGIRSQRLEEKRVMGSRLFVGNISFKAADESLRDLFEQYGQVRECRIVIDRETNRPKGFAFVEMGTQDEAADAISNLDKCEFEGRALNVSEARPKAEQTR
jgi:hypothetical protein